MSNHSSERPYLSIGEVLGLLLDEFPDVTISKIRFLESQGLIEPERTPSGYRKFYDADVDRLRFILREQREHYLPLKVIRDRLEGDTPSGGVPRPAEPTAPLERPAPDPGDGAAHAELPSDAAVRSHPAGSTPLPAAPEPVTAEPAPQAEVEAPAATPAPATPPSRPIEIPPTPAPAAGPGQLARAELLGAAGIDAALLEQLESYGLVTPRSVGQQVVYDATARQICELAGRFQALGIEVRHLRAWKTSAEREASLFEQRILPLLRQRNPQAREHSAAIVDELATLGANLRHVLVTQALQQYLT